MYHIQILTSMGPGNAVETNTSVVTVDAHGSGNTLLTGVELGPLGAGHNGSHAGLRGHPGH